jgi:hypothetical protein
VPRRGMAAVAAASVEAKRVEGEKAAEEEEKEPEQNHAHQRALNVMYPCWVPTSEESGCVWAPERSAAAVCVMMRGRPVTGRGQIGRGWVARVAPPDLETWGDQARKHGRSRRKSTAEATAHSPARGGDVALNRGQDVRVRTVTVTQRLKFGKWFYPFFKSRC